LFDRCGNRFLYRWFSDGEGYEVKGDCNICVNGKLPFDSATCVECGLSRKNYKPITNYDRIISKTPEELARDLAIHVGCNMCPGWSVTCGEECEKYWLDWLKEEAT
jgi:hypothetical protein